MENIFNRASCSRQEPLQDSVFKVPRPVFKYGANRLINSQLQNGSELSYRMNKGGESFNSSRNMSRYQLQLNRGNETTETSKLGRNISTNASETSLFKIPKLGAEYRKNELQPMSFAAEPVASTSTSESHLQLDTRKSFMYNSGFSSSRSTNLVQQGLFNSTISLSNKESRQNSILQNSSRLPFNITSNVDENQSVAGSVVSMMSNMSTVALAAQYVNVFEILESSLVKISNKPEVTRAQLRKAKEVVVTSLQNEQNRSLAVRDVDASSVFSESARSLCSTFSKALPNARATKSHREILAELKVNQQGITSGQTSQIQFFTSFEASRRNDKTVDRMDTINENAEDADTTVIFNNDKRLKINTKRKAIADKPSEKEVLSKGKKDAKSNEALKSKQDQHVIILRNWFPVASNGSLILNGETEDKNFVETKPIKKRINNRKVELLDGKLCEIIGSPSTSVVSAFPKSIMQKLKDGLHMQWKVLQKDLADCQKNFNSKLAKKIVVARKNEIVKQTPTTRKVVQEPEVSSSTPLRRKEPEEKKKSENIRREPVVVLKRSDMSVAKSKEGGKDGGKKTKVQEKKIVEAPVVEQKKSNNEEPVVRSRTGRVIKPVGDLWRDFFAGSKTNNRNNSTLVVQKRKLEENRNEAQEVKRPKIKKASPEKKKKEKSPELDDDSSDDSIPSPRKKGTPLPKNLITDKKSKAASKAEKNKKNIKSKKNEKNQKQVEKEKISKNSKPAAKNYNDSFEYSLGDIDIPEVETHNSKTQLSKSQIRAISMETPPLKYFTGNLHLANTTQTPKQSPEWQLSQRTNSEVKRFQTRREKTFKQKIPVKKAEEVSKTRKSLRIKELNNVMDWIADKDVKSPKKQSKLLNLVIPSRRQEEEEDDESDDGDSDV